MSTDWLILSQAARWVTMEVANVSIVRFVQNIDVTIHYLSPSPGSFLLSSYLSTTVVPTMIYLAFNSFTKWMHDKLYLLFALFYLHSISRIYIRYFDEIKINWFDVQVLKLNK